MLRKYCLFCISLVLVFYLPFFAYAHPGRTDGNGGHTDKSTGEYHYHHGYSAHDHWDMDGDGDIDCPYKFDDKTDHNSNTNSSSNTTPQAKPSNNKTYAYIAIGFVVAFFILVNCLAIHIDKTDKTPRDEPISIPSVLISIISTVIVFGLMFYIMCLYKQPIQLREIQFGDMIEVLFISAFPSGIVWLVTNSLSGLVNVLLCRIFEVEPHYGFLGPFQRLTLPLSYAFMVLLFILQ